MSGSQLSFITWAKAVDAVVDNPGIRPIDLAAHLGVSGQTAARLITRIKCQSFRQSYLIGGARETSLYD